MQISFTAALLTQLSLAFLLSQSSSSAAIDTTQLQGNSQTSHSSSTQHLGAPTSPTRKGTLVQDKPKPSLGAVIADCLERTRAYVRDDKAWVKNCAYHMMRIASLSAPSPPPLAPCGSSSTTKQCVFVSPAHLKTYLQKIDSQHAISSRPRFGKRSVDAVKATLLNLDETAVEQQTTNSMNDSFGSSPQWTGLMDALQPEWEQA